MIAAIHNRSQLILVASIAIILAACSHSQEIQSYGSQSSSQTALTRPRYCQMGLELSEAQWPLDLVRGHRRAPADEVYQQAVRRAAYAAVQSIWLDRELTPQELADALTEMRCQYHRLAPYAELGDEILTVEYWYEREDRDILVDYGSSRSFASMERKVRGLLAAQDHYFLDEAIERVADVKDIHGLPPYVMDYGTGYRADVTKTLPLTIEGLLPSGVYEETGTDRHILPYMQCSSRKEVDSRQPFGTSNFDFECSSMTFYMASAAAHERVLEKLADLLDKMKHCAQARLATAFLSGSNQAAQLHEIDRLAHRLLSEFAYLSAHWSPWGQHKGNWGVLYTVLAQARRLLLGDLSSIRLLPRFGSLDEAMQTLVTTADFNVDRANNALDLLLLLGAYSSRDAEIIYGLWKNGIWDETIHTPEYEELLSPQPLESGSR